MTGGFLGRVTIVSRTIAVYNSITLPTLFFNPYCIKFPTNPSVVIIQAPVYIVVSFFFRSYLSSVRHFLAAREFLDKAVKQIGKNVTDVQGDISNLADLDRLYETVKQQKGRIDVLFANAGVGEFSRLAAITEGHFDKT